MALVEARHNLIRDIEVTCTHSAHHRVLQSHRSARNTFVAPSASKWNTAWMGGTDDVSGLVVDSGGLVARFVAGTRSAGFA
jgi:hypothetical protein